MLVADFNKSVRYTLQDIDKRRWSDAELLDYANEGMRDIALKTFYNRIVEKIAVTSINTSYTLSKPAIKIASIDTSQKYNIVSNDTIEFDNPKDEEITVYYYAYPDTIIDLINEEIDIIDALKYFVLHKCYEKEDSPENFNKSVYFHNKYIDYINDNMTRWHGDASVTLAKSDYFL